MKAQRLPEDDEDEQEEEYAALLAIFNRFVDSFDNPGAERWGILEDLMRKRAQIGLAHALRGFDMTIEEADRLLSDEDELDEEELEKRMILMAAIGNIAEFSVAEEHKMIRELSFLNFDTLELEVESPEDLEKVSEGVWENAFKRYNKQYSNVENKDIEYAMIVALGLSEVERNTVLTYATMGDERVRPWHRIYEGYSAPKYAFPAWLVPPIEHMCRCYLIEESVSASIPDVQAKNWDDMKTPPDWMDPTFKESVAFGGRIFSDEHPYFEVPVVVEDRLRNLSLKIKEELLNGVNY